MFSQIQMRANSGSIPLFVCLVGEEKCQAGHAYGPMQRGYYLIHFVLDGCGTLYCDGQEYAIGPGQGFLIRPDDETYYQASMETPWHYAWVGYQGTQAEALTRQAGLDGEHRIFAARDQDKLWQLMQDMQMEVRGSPVTQISAVGNLLRFFGAIAPVQNPLVSNSLARQYCEKVQWYLEGRYDRNVTIQDAADYVGLSRSRLYRVMMAEMGCAPKELLNSIRMNHAARLLRTTSLTVEDVARRVGLQTGAQLGIAFKKAFGVSPGRYRKQSAQEVEWLEEAVKD